MANDGEEEVTISSLNQAVSERLVDTFMYSSCCGVKLIQLIDKRVYSNVLGFSMNKY